MNEQITTEQIITDSDLLNAFLDNADDAAFSAIVERHGAMVYGVCKRVIIDHHDAEDAAQATFAVLAQKAESIRKRNSLGSWLHGVAKATSNYAIRSRVNRNKREELYMSTVEPTQEQEEAHPPEMIPLLDNAIAKLSDNQREAILLRHLQNNSVDIAARLAGCSSEAMKSRTKGGMKNLRGFFSHRKVAVSATMLLSVLQVQAATTVPKSVISSCVAASKLVTTSIASEVVGSSVISITQGVLKVMFYKQLKVAALLMVGTVFTGVLVQQSVARGDNRPSVPVVELSSYEKLSRSFMKARFELDLEKVSSSFADNVIILPGHEVLKKRYDLTLGQENSNSTIKVDRKRATTLSLQLFEEITTQKGDYSIDMKDLIMNKSQWTYYTPEEYDMKYPFDRAFNAENRIIPIRKGDVVLLITGWVPNAIKLRNDDHILLVMRRVNDKWKIIMDCVNW
jgi:RNA polymerase sigma factor (sigma-70 family)